ncbi:hypothetical protein APED_17340 [Acanthopleuribacter pedis]
MGFVWVVLLKTGPYDHRFSTRAAASPSSPVIFVEVVEMLCVSGVFCGAFLRRSEAVLS